MTSELEKNMRATTEALLHEFDGSWQPSATLHLRAPTCEHEILPKSLNAPKRTNADYEKYFERVAPLVSEAKMTMVDYLAVPSERRVVCFSSIKAETVVGHYENEYVWFLWFDETGKQITRIREFLDGMAAKGLLARLKESEGGDGH